MGFLELRRQCGVSHEVPQGFQGASCVASENPVFHSSCKLELGIALQSLQGKIDLIYACVQDLEFMLNHVGVRPDFLIRVTRHGGCEALEIVRVAHFIGSGSPRRTMAVITAYL